MNAAMDIFGVDTAAILIIHDPESERYEVSAHIAHWGAIWGDALAEKVQADAAYRHWHAQALVTLLRDEEKVAEWKARAVVEGDPNFLKHKERIAQAERRAKAAEGIFPAYSRKGDILARLIGRENTERVAANNVGREPHEELPPQDPKPERTARVMASMRATKERTTTSKGTGHAS